MLNQYSVLDSKSFHNKLKILANKYSPWGKLKFSNMAPFFGGLCEEMGEKNLKKAMVSETSYDFIVQPDSELEACFRQAIISIGLEDEFLKSYRKVLEKKDDGVSHVFLYVHYAELALKKAPVIKFMPTQFLLCANKTPKKKMLNVSLEWYEENFPPDVKKYIESHWFKNIVSGETYKLLKSVAPNISFESVIIETKTSTDEWYALNLDGCEETSLNIFKRENKSYTIFDFNLDEFKQSESFIVDDNTFLLTVEDFDFLCQKKVFPKSHRSWVGNSGHWSIRFF